ncbi:MAG TPA: Lrp/AsnC family transcriptional regulator [Thermoplasmata archaeon]|nr:Lrp/AsnC family transcriptional regulator [Thermoplasmata archaeon]
MDDTDREIVARLREDARATNAEIGRGIGLTESAVRRRIGRMRSEGTIRRFTTVTVPLGPEGLVLVRCRPGRTADILQFIGSRATEVFETSGEFDLGAIVERSTMEQLNHELDEIRSRDGVESTLTLIRLSRTFGPSRARERVDPVAPGTAPGARKARPSTGRGPSRDARASR